MASTAIIAYEAVHAHTLASDTLGKISAGVDIWRKTVCSILTGCCLTSYTAEGMRLLDSKEMEKSAVCVYVFVWRGCVGGGRVCVDGGREGW